MTWRVMSAIDLDHVDIRIDMDGTMTMTLPAYDGEGEGIELERAGADDAWTPME